MSPRSKKTRLILSSSGIVVVVWVVASALLAWACGVSETFEEK
jgi:hypothetical protein